MGDYEVHVTEIVDGIRKKGWTSIPFFKTSIHSAKVEASHLVSFRFQRKAGVPELANKKKWDNISENVWSKTNDKWIIELRFLGERGYEVHKKTTQDN